MLFSILAALLMGAIGYFLLKQAPFVDEPFRSIALWVILAAVVIYCVAVVFGWAGLIPNPFHAHGR
jgi:hypothetical protein